MHDFFEELNLVFVSSVVLSLAVAGVLQWIRHKPWTFSLLSFPGTLAHELSHYFVGVMLLAKPTQIEMLPKKLPNGMWQLGSVKFLNLNLWNSTPVALAPLLLWPAGLILCAHWIPQRVLSGEWDLVTLGAYLAAQCWSGGWPSREDWQLAMPSLILYMATVVVLYAVL